tara:strand:+ start:101 stop:352 length:252 start_codon:yes stop_codon:yes gene_type:complete
MDGDTIAVIFLCCIAALPILLILGALIADASPANSPITNFMNWLFDNVLEDDRHKPPVQMGKKGGRYEMRISSKTGRPYRHYF